ncbi:MAG: hypothetical protein LBR23_01700 [Spirochaetaceae bacterium]|jgi:hypothetical protein|nr:hypothetical protein [Spirochaetaceae bacterium]
MAEKRIRLEVIMSAALEDDFLRSYEAACTGAKYTRISDATGKGYSVPKLGDAVWPQVNTIIVIYCGESDEEAIRGIIADLRQEYAGEGLACFRSEAEEV